MSLKNVRARASVGVALLVALALLPACGHDSTSSTESSGGRTAPSGVWGAITGSETKQVHLQGGKATFTINRSGPHHLEMEFNSGLVADVDWKENAGSEFGYDIYEPEVSETTNRLALMLALRGIIASYLKGEYD